MIRHRPRTRSVSPRELIMGCQAGLDALALAQATGSILIVTAPMDQSPHVELLRSVVGRNRATIDELIVGSSYWDFAQQIREVTGEFFGARTDQALLEVVRNFIEWALHGTMRSTPIGGARPEDGVLVARIAGSRYFQVVDGHHRVATAIVRGDEAVVVRQTWLRAESPTELVTVG